MKMLASRFGFLVGPLLLILEKISSKNSPQEVSTINRDVMSNKKIVGNLKISFQNSSRYGDVTENNERVRKLKNYLEKGLPNETTLHNKKLINDRHDLQNIFDEVRQVVENESDLEFIEIKSESGESSSSLQSTVASYNIHEELDREDDILLQHRGYHGNTTEINKKSNVTIDELKIENLTHLEENIWENSRKQNKNKVVQSYINTFTSSSPPAKTPQRILSPQNHLTVPSLKTIQNAEIDEVEKQKQQNLFLKNIIEDLLPKSPEPLSSQSSTNDEMATPTTLKRVKTSSTTSNSVKIYKDIIENKRMERLREEYFNYKLAKREVETKNRKPNIVDVYAEAVCKNVKSETSIVTKTRNDETRRDDILLPCKQNPSKLFHSSINIKNSENESSHHEYTIHDIRNRIKNNTSRVQKKILKLNLLNANANRPTTLDGKKTVIKYDRDKPSTNNDLILRHTMIDNYFQHYGHSKEDVSYFNNTYQKTDYNQGSYFDDGYGSESNRTYSSSVSQSMETNGFSDLINTHMYARDNSMYIDTYNDSIMSTNYSDVPPPLHKKYSKSHSALDNLMTQTSRESKYHDVELERENRKTIHGKLENLLKEKVKSMNDLNKAATLPPKKYKQNYVDSRPLDKTKTLPSNYMQEHVYNQLYGNLGPSQLNLEIESDEEYDPTPVRRNLPPGLSKPPAIYNSGGGDSKDAALRESMLSELKKTVKGRSMKQKEKAESLFSPSKKPMKRDESESRIQRRQQKMANEMLDNNTAAMNVLNDFDLMNASFENESNERITRENYQNQAISNQRPRSRSQVEHPHIINNKHSSANNGAKKEPIIQRSTLPSAKFVRENHTHELAIQNNAKSNTSEQRTPRDDMADDIYLFDSFPLPKNFTLPAHSKPTSPSINSKNEKFDQDNSRSKEQANQLEQKRLMKLETGGSFSHSNYPHHGGRNDESSTDLSPTDLEIKSILEEHNKRVQSRSQQQQGSSKSPRNQSTSKTLNNQAERQNMVERNNNQIQKIEKPKSQATQEQRLSEPQQRLSLIEKRTSNLSASTMTLSNKKMSEKIIEANILKQQEKQPRSKSAADIRQDDREILNSYILKDSAPPQRQNKDPVAKRPSAYDELTSKIIQARAYEQRDISIEELRKEMTKKKVQSTSLINLDEINKTPTKETHNPTENNYRSPVRSNTNEKFTRQTYTATNIGKVSIPKQFQNTDYRFSSSPKSIRDQGISRSTPASPTKRARSFSFNSRKSPVPRPKSTQSANTSRPSTPKFITNKIRSLFSPRSKRKSRSDVSSDVLLTDSDEFIARRTNMNRSIGNEGYDIDDIVDSMNGDMSDDGDDIDVDFITNQDWLHQEQQHMKNKPTDVKGNADINNNNLPNGHAPTEHEVSKHKDKKEKKMKPYIKGSLIPTSRNGSIQLKSKHGIGKVVVPDVFSHTSQSPRNQNTKYKQNQNFSTRSSTLSERSDLSLQNGKIPNTDKSYVQSAAYAQQNGHVANGHENVMVKRNRRMQDVPASY